MKPKHFQRRFCLIFIVYLWCVCSFARTENWTGSSLFSESQFASGYSIHEEKVYTVEEARELSDLNPCWIRGYLVGCVSTKGALITDSTGFVKTNLALGSDPVGTTYLSVQLPTGEIRNALNLQENKSHLGLPVKILGIPSKYASVAGVKNVSGYEFISGPLIITTPSVITLKKGATAILKVTGRSLEDTISIRTEKNGILLLDRMKLAPDIIEGMLEIKAIHPGTEKITLESGNAKETIMIHCLATNNDTRLKSLKVGKETVQLANAFFPYQLQPVPFSTRSVNITASTADNLAFITEGTGNYDLKIGNNIIRIQVMAENGNVNVYELHLTRLCESPSITKQPVFMSVCEGNACTFEVKAAGDGLSYQWYFDDCIIPEAESRIYKLTGTDREKNNGNYQVKINGACGSEYSDVVSLWVTSPLPSKMEITEIPDIVSIGKTYRAILREGADLNDVSDYTWSFSGGNADFYCPAKENNYINYITFLPNALSGRLTVELSHVCGKRKISKNLKISALTEIDRTENPGIIVFPNPVNTVLNVKSPYVIYSVTITDLSGKIIDIILNKDTNEIIIPAEKWEKGTYILTINTIGGIFNQIIIHH